MMGLKCCLKSEESKECVECFDMDLVSYVLMISTDKLIVEELPFLRCKGKISEAASFMPSHLLFTK